MVALMDHCRSENAALSLARSAARGFVARFGRPPRFLAAAPGRVNFIGEHLDYNDGYVLPLAIDRYTIVAADRGDAGLGEVDIVRAASSVCESQDTVTFDARYPGGVASWAQYVAGPLALCAQHGLSTGPIDLWVESNVPLGAGLSSSAALEVAVATIAEAVTGRSLAPVEKARICQQAEHEYAGVPCGIMDQTASVLAEDGRAMLLDCRSGHIEQIAFDDPAVAVLIANTNVRHHLNNGEYALRRNQCELAARAIGVVSLRDADDRALESARPAMPDAVYRRARHVVSEIERTLRAAAAMRRRDWAALGELMFASHASLRNDFEVSCVELDAMFDIARRIGLAGGVYGSRMTGGGFGGCTVSLVAADAADAIAGQMRQDYQHITGIEPGLFVTCPSRGAHAIDPEPFFSEKEVL